MKPNPENIDALLMAKAKEADALSAKAPQGGSDLVEATLQAILPGLQRLDPAIVRKAVEEFLADHPKLATVEDAVAAINGPALMSFRAILARLADAKEA